MSKTTASTEDQCNPEFTEIRIKGHLADRWADWFDGLTIMLTAEGNTLLSGLVVDQAALYGLLRKVRDLGMPLLTVQWVEPSLQDTPDAESQHEHSNEDE